MQGDMPVLCWLLMFLSVFGVANVNALIATVDYQVDCFVNMTEIGIKANAASATTWTLTFL